MREDRIKFYSFINGWFVFRQLSSIFIGMNTIRINTTQNIELEYELAGAGERIVAWLIDVVIFIAYFIVVSVIINATAGIDNFVRNNPWLSFLFLIPFVFYNLFCDTIFNGQTVGKKVMSIKVVSLNGNQPSVGQYMIRWLFRLIDIYTFNGLPAFICVIASEKKQRIGDMVAGTTLIKTSPRTVFQQTIYAPTPDVNYTVSFPEVVNLSDADVQLIREVQMHILKTGNLYLAYPTAEKIKNLLHVQTNLEAAHFLNVVIADYNHLTSKL
jgi:uncharacterized RDD family membrane protein YckC